MFFFYNRMLNIAAFLVLLCAIVSPSFGQDLYEVDDTYAKATIIVVNAKDNASQHHTIHQADDTDWIKFYALEGKDYHIFAFNQTPEMNGYIELYETDGETLIIRINTGGANHPENFDLLNWYCTVEGIYYAKIGLAWPEDYADGSEYDLQVYDPNLFSLPGYLTGMVLSTAGKAISGAVIKLTGSEDMGSGISLGDGSFLAAVKEGSYTIDVTANGYQSAARSGVAVPGSVNFALNTVPVALADQVETIRGGTVTDNVLEMILMKMATPLQAFSIQGLCTER